MDKIVAARIWKHPVSLSEHLVPDSELLKYNMKRPGSSGLPSGIQRNVLAQCAKGKGSGLSKVKLSGDSQEEEVLMVLGRSHLPQWSGCRGSDQCQRLERRAATHRRAWSPAKRGKPVAHSRAIEAWTSVKGWKEGLGPIGGLRGQ
jgi:hypothetical protein